LTKYFTFIQDSLVEVRTTPIKNKTTQVNFSALYI